MRFSCATIIEAIAARLHYGRFGSAAVLMIGSIVRPFVPSSHIPHPSPLFPATLLLTSLLFLTGCVGQYVPGFVPPPTAAVVTPPQSEPAFIPNMDRDLVWNQLVDVMDDYFKVEREDRVKLIGDVLTEGTLTTYPRTGSTIFEPWNKDSVNPHERWESTLQSIRRKSIVRVTPTDGGFLVDVAVFKELEDVARPESFGATAANLRNDDSVQRFNNPVGGQPQTVGWIPLGRDVALEQTILGHLQARFGGSVMVAPPGGVRAF